MYRFVFRMIISAFLLITAFMHPTAGAAKQFSLTQSINLAMENNHELKAFRSFLKASGEDIGIARSLKLPKIALEHRFIRTNNPAYAFSLKMNQERLSNDDFMNAPASFNTPSLINDYQTVLSFEQPIFFRKADIGVNMAQKEYMAKNADYIRKKEEVALKVIHAYLAVRTTGEYVTVAGKAVNEAKEHLRIAQLKHKAGLGLYSDTLRAATAVTDAEQRLVSAQKDLHVAKRQLGLLLGLSEPVEIADENPELPVLGVDYYRHAALSRQDVKSLELRYENAKNSVKLAEAGRLPMIAIGGSYQMDDHDQPFGSEGSSWELIAFLKWDVFDGAKTEHEKEKAKLKLAETGEHLQEIKKAVLFKVYEAYLGVEAARKNVELARSAVNTAEEGKRLVKIRYENSLSPIVDLLDAQVHLDHAKANLVAKENAYRLAIANLYYESGTILSSLKIDERM